MHEVCVNWGGGEGRRAGWGCEDRAGFGSCTDGSKILVSAAAGICY